MEVKGILEELSKKYVLDDVDVRWLNSEVELTRVKVEYCVVKARQKNMSFYDSLVKYTALKRFTKKLDARDYSKLAGRLKEIEVSSVDDALIEDLSLELFQESDYTKDIYTHYRPQSCFGFDIWRGEGASLHFTNAVVPKNPLEGDELDERRKELKQILKDIRVSHPEVRYVFSVSWMWNLPIFRGLMPEEFNESLTEFTESEFYSLGHWGQFIRHDGSLNEERLTQFRKTWEFPMRILIGKCDITKFP